MDLINTGTDPWILEYEACEALNRDIWEQLNVRSNQEISSKEYDVLSARIRNRLKQFTVEVEQLCTKLKSASVVSSITSEEHERRRRQVEFLQGNILKIQDQFNRRNVNNYPIVHTSKERSDLFGGKNTPAVFSDVGTTNWGDVDNNEAAKPDDSEREYKTVDDLRIDQQRMLKEQDEGLESLSKIISRQVQIATTINIEVNQQNDLLDDMSQNVERVEARIHQETNMVKRVGRKDNTCGYWVIILLLLAAIIGVSVA